MTTDQDFLRTEGDVNWSEQRQKWAARFPAASATANQLAEDATYFLHQSLSTPCLDVLTHSDGVTITNLEGKSYYDFHGNNVHQLGYNNRFIIDRLKEQLDTLAFCPRRFTNAPSITLAKRLAGLSDDVLKRVLFVPGGTSAISMALRLARLATGKHKTLAMFDSFHGASLDSISVGGERVFQEGLGPLMAGSIHVPPVDSYRGFWYKEGEPDSDLAYAEYINYILEKEGDIGVLVAEPIRSTVVHIPSVAYWKRIREICDQHGVLLVFDEIPTGFGRTGKMFAHQHFGISPDILVLGKGLGAGLIPMAAILCREELNIAQKVSLGHFTHEKSPLGAAAALAMLDYIDEHDVLTHVEQIAQLMQQRLLRWKEQFEIVGDVRGTGALWALEMVRSKATKEKYNEAAEAILYACLEKGLSLKVSDGNVICLYPPLIITVTELNKALAILEEALLVLQDA